MGFPIVMVARERRRLLHRAVRWQRLVRQHATRLLNSALKISL
jgi:hypothetical protein